MVARIRWNDEQLHSEIRSKLQMMGGSCRRRLLGDGPMMGVRQGRWL